MLFKVNGEVMNLTEVLSEIENNIPEEVYDEMLDECYEEVEICGYTYSPSVALYRVDKIAYDCGFNDYKDNILNDISSEVECMESGEVQEFYGIEVECIEE